MHTSSPPAESALLERIDLAVQIDDIAAAMELALQALNQGVETPLVLNLAAFQLERDGRARDALPMLDRALKLAPNDPLVCNALGRVYGKLGRPMDALPAFEAAIQLAPAYSTAHNGRGLALEAIGRDEEAVESYRAAIRLDAANPEALGAMAAIAMRRNDEDAPIFAERALALDPWQPAATLALASQDLRDGKFSAVGCRLAPLLDRGGLAPLHEASARRMLADALDAQGEAQPALAQYDAANRLLREVHAATFNAPGTENGVALCERLGRYFAAAPAWDTAPGAQASLARTHVFLVGFPRSGTTLLEQVLASHPSVEALEERATLGDVGAWFEDAEALDRLDHLDEAQAADLRTTYWARVEACGANPVGKVFVDKLPLNSLWLPYVAKLFPDAKVLFARRDPRDVVLSCFRRRFVINGATYHFTDLADLARFYAAVMGLAEVYRAKLGLDWCVHRHEDLIEDFDAEGKRVCAFLGLPWTEAMRDFAETAKRRDVRTPSAQQVRRGLYREGMGQWRAYAEGMADALPVLQPWVERFGYPAE